MADDKEKAFEELMKIFSDMNDKVESSGTDDDKKAEAKAAMAAMFGALFRKTAEKEAEEAGEEYIPPAETIHMEDTDKFFEEHFKGSGKVWHELVSEVVHIDVHVIDPTDDRPYYVLYTTGMSDLPMTVPESFTEEQKKEYSYAELMMFLPPDWKLDEESMKDDRWYWPVRAIKKAARFPHYCGTWIGHCHDLQFTEPCEPFAENTKLCALMFAYLLDKKLQGFTASDGCYINLYCCIPIYEEELAEKIQDLDEGGTELLIKLFGNNDVPIEKLVIDIDRKNTAV